MPYTASGSGPQNLPDGGSIHPIPPLLGPRRTESEATGRKLQDLEHPTLVHNWSYQEILIMLRIQYERTEIWGNIRHINRLSLTDTTTKGRFCFWPWQRRESNNQSPEWLPNSSNGQMHRKAAKMMQIVSDAQEQGKETVNGWRLERERCTAKNRVADLLYGLSSPSMAAWDNLSRLQSPCTLTRVPGKDSSAKATLTNLDSKGKKECFVAFGKASLVALRYCCGMNLTHKEENKCSVAAKKTCLSEETALLCTSVSDTSGRAAGTRLTCLFLLCYPPLPLTVCIPSNPGS